MSSSDGDPGQRGGEVLLVLVTAPEAEARELARTLVQERLTACGNVIPGVRSIYRWEGAVEEAEEALLVLKTTRSLEPRLVQRIPELHSYDVPEVLVFEVKSGHAPYLSWVARESGPAPEPGGG